MIIRILLGSKILLCDVQESLLEEVDKSGNEVHESTKKQIKITGLISTMRKIHTRMHVCARIYMCIKLSMKGCTFGPYLKGGRLKTLLR